MDPWTGNTNSITLNQVVPAPSRDQSTWNKMVLVENVKVCIQK